MLKPPAIMLKSRKWGEADRIVTFYTVRFGKLRGVARGARRMKSRFGSSLEPFVHCDLNLFEKHNDPLYRITQADIRETFPRLREDLAAMSGAARMVNLVAAVTAEGDPAPRIFQTLLGGLRWLQDGGDPALTALLFQLKLLGQTGFRPQTDHCAACGATFPDLPCQFLHRYDIVPALVRVEHGSIHRQRLSGRRVSAGHLRADGGPRRADAVRTRPARGRDSGHGLRAVPDAGRAVGPGRKVIGRSPVSVLCSRSAWPQKEGEEGAARPSFLLAEPPR